MKNKTISFLDISNLGSDIPETVKDEMRIASLHGLNLTPFVHRFKNDSERIHYIRLLVQNNYINISDKILNDLDSDILRILVKYMETHTDFRVILSKYISKNNNLMIEKESLVKILLGYLKYPQIIEYDFLDIKPELVDTFIFAIKSGVDVKELQYSNFPHSTEVVKLLVNLKIAGLSIMPFIKGNWRTNQVYALISGSSIVKPEILIEDYDIDETFPSGSIKEIIRAYEISPELASLVSIKDEDGVPIYNQYQMYEVSEGVRLGLDVSSYYKPNITDLEMRLRREELIKMEEKRTGKRFKERVLSKTNIKLNDEQLDKLLQK